MTAKTLHFVDTKKYSERLKDAQEKTFKDAIRTGVGKSKGNELVVCCMDLPCGGSMVLLLEKKICAWN
jgi:acetyl-CoA carboxylase carboxyl transferase subunit beta